MSRSRSISSLRLSHFRNYSTAALDLDPRPVVLTGPNGAGKTNLMEAISLLSPGRGLRRAPFENLKQNGSDAPWGVAASIETWQGPVDLGTGEVANESGRRARINGANARTIEALADYVRILWLTPAMDGLFAGAPAERRRFLDRLVLALFPGHSRHLSDFEKAMRQRNRLLSDSAEPAWFDATEVQMAELGSAIHFARLDSLGKLQHLALSGLDGDDFPAAVLRLDPGFVSSGTMHASTDLEAAFVAMWRDARDADRAAGRTLAGPHRADLEVIHAQKQMPAALCSTGEQKALLVGLVLAHARVVAETAGIAPLLLLDEIAAHLDPHRRARLFAILLGLEGQCFMTGTDAMLFEAFGTGAQHFEVDGGRVTLTA